MATVADLCTQALQRLMVLQSDETPSAADLSTSFTVLNQLMDQWAGERLTIPNITRTTWTIVSGTSSYSVGTGATINAARPVFVNSFAFSDSAVTPAVELPMVRLTDEAYAAYPIKTLTSPRPQYAWYNPTYPTGTVILLPVPTSSTLTGVMYAQTAVAQFSATSDTVSLPPGYQRFIITNLALDLAPMYEREPTTSLIQAAMDSKAGIMRDNIKLYDLTIDRGALVQGPYMDRQAFYSGLS